MAPRRPQRVAKVNEDVTIVLLYRGAGWELGAFGSRGIVPTWHPVIMATLAMPPRSRRR